MRYKAIFTQATAKSKSRECDLLITHGEDDDQLNVWADAKAWEAIKKVDGVELYVPQIHSVRVDKRYDRNYVAFDIMHAVRKVYRNG